MANQRGWRSWRGAAGMAVLAILLFRPRHRRTSNRAAPAGKAPEFHESSAPPVDTLVTGREITLTTRVEKALGSAQNLVGLNVVIVAILYLQEWIYRNSFLSVFGLHPEDVGLSTQFLLLRAGLHFIGLLAVAAPLLCLLYFHEVRIRRGITRRRHLLPVCIFFLLVIGFTLLNYQVLVDDRDPGDRVRDVALSSISYSGLAGIAFLLTTGLTRNKGRRIIVGLLLVLPVAMSGFVSMQIYGQASAESLSQRLMDGQPVGLRLTRLGIPHTDYPVVRVRTSEGAFPSSSQCGILLGTNSGTTYVFTHQVVRRDETVDWIIWTTFRLPTEATVINGC